jgi:DNA-binding response OmpR family regulator
MVVDDEPDLRDIFRYFLEEAGYAVCQAEDGRAALDLLGLLALGEDLPGLILLDLSMPLMSGYDLLVALNADPRFALIPTLTVTASAVTKPPLATAMLRKPFDPDTLLHRVGELCRPHPNRCAHSA